MLQGTLGPNPLLIAATDNNTLTSSIGRSVLIDPIDPPTDLADAKGAIGETLRYFRPSSPLADGAYSFVGRSFTVSSSVSEAAPNLDTRSTLELYLSGEDPDGECGDLSMLMVDLLDAPLSLAENGMFLVRFERADGSGFSRLVSLSERYEATVRLRFFHSFTETGHLRDEKLCVKISAVSSSGLVGSSVDLGCVDPTDPADPRVFRPESSGCSASGAIGGVAPAAQSTVWLLFGLFSFAYLRRRSAV